MNTAAEPRPISRTHLANERTLLAWVRTSLSVVALGLGVAAFLGSPTGGTHLYDALAIGLVAAGVVVMLVGFARFRAATRAIDTIQR